MKRIGTVFLILFSFITVAAHGQSARIAPSQKTSELTKRAQSQSLNIGTIPPSDSKNSDEVQTIFKTEGVSYIQDTSGANWWVYAPIINQATGDSLGYFHGDQFTDGESLYFTNDDSIGPEEIGYQNSLGSIVDTTAFDTMYNRVMAIRVTPPTDLGNAVYLDSANIPFYVESLDPGDVIRVWAVPIADEELSNNTGPFPFPDLLTGSPIAKTTISPSKVTAGQLNSITVSFGTGGKALNTAEKKEIAVCVFVDGPNFSSDTVGYMLEADAQSPPSQGFSIDTDGSGQEYTGPDTGYIPMRTYLLGLDGGNLTIDGTNSPISGGQYFVEISQVDETGMPTGQEYDGNLAITTYFHGTAKAGVSQDAANESSLDGNYPNPVSTTSEINYNLATSGPVTLNVYNTLGEQVASVVNAIQGPGAHSATFNAKGLPDGMYYYKLQSGEFTATQSMVISK